MAVKIRGTGNAANPSITGDDDDTGLVYGTNQIDFSTGGTTRATVDSSGFLGVGTTSPSSFNADGRNLVVGTGSGGQGLSIYSANNNYGNIYFADGTSDGSYNAGGILYNHSSNFMRFDTAAAERIRIDSSGNVGVSTTSPVAQTTAGGTALTPVLDLKGVTQNNTSGVLQLTRKDNATQGSCIYSSGDDAGLTMRNTDGNGFGFYNGTALSLRVRPNGTIVQKITNTTDTNGENNAWSSFNSENANTYDLKILNNASNPASNYTLEIKAKADVDNTNYRHINCTKNNNSTGIFVVYGNGNVQNANNSYGQTSDVKLKENITDANSQWDDIKALRVRNFNFKADSGYSTHRQIGLIAQEAETVSAGLIENVNDVTEDENGVKLETGTVTKQLKYSVLYMKAIKALQEAQTRIETLETKVAALEAT